MDKELINDLDEAIKYHEEHAEAFRKRWDYYKTQKMKEYIPAVKICTKKHEQLAKWLKDYKRLLDERPQGEWKPLLLKTLNEEGGDIVAYKSSCCGAVADKKYQHCPKCLAKMKGGAE